MVLITRPSSNSIMRNKKIYHAVGTNPKYNPIFLERGKIDISNTHIDVRSQS